MNPNSSLAAPIARTLRVLNELGPRAIVVDGHGDAWQQGSFGYLGGVGDGYWYRAFDGEGRSAWDAAQVMGPKIVVLKKGAGS